MKTFLITLLILFSSIGVSFSQVDYQISSAMDFFRANKMATGEYKNQLTESDIQGSPYLNDDFLNGIVFTTSKIQFVDIPLRYNIYNDDIEFKTHDNKILAMSTPEIIEKVKFGEYTMVYIPYASAKKMRRGFFVLLEDGAAKLYARPQVHYRQPEEPGAYKEATPAKFLEKTRYLLYPNWNGRGKKSGK